jgi:RNA polymerase sigma-70 factor (ECF subfamily)
MGTIASPVTAVLPGIRQQSEGSVPRLRELTAALARGDDAAWAEFHRDYGPEIFRYVLGGTRGDYDLAAEALQQTYLRVARYAHPCGDGREFAGWLRTLASSALNDCRRRRRSFWSRFVTADRGGETAAAPIELSESDHVFLALDQALARLGAEERALLQEKYFSGADVRSLAARFDITPKALESRLTRARAELRRQLTAILSRHE